MTIESVIRNAEADGVSLSLSERGTVKATGNAAAVSKWLPVLRQRKPDIESALASMHVDGPAALVLLNRSGACVLFDHPCTVAIPRRCDTPKLRRALALLGYGGYKVVHADTNNRCQGIAVVKAALRAAGEPLC